jgi:hypothetical protein
VTHFPTLEAPNAVADALEAFASELASVPLTRSSA